MSDAVLLSVAITAAQHCGLQPDKFHFEFYQAKYSTVMSYEMNGVLHLNRYMETHPCIVVGSIAYFTNFRNDRALDRVRAARAERCCEGLE